MNQNNKSTLSGSMRKDVTEVVLVWHLTPLTIFIHFLLLVWTDSHSFLNFQQMYSRLKKLNSQMGLDNLILLSRADSHCFHKELWEHMLSICQILLTLCRKMLKPWGTVAADTNSNRQFM